MKIKIMKSHRVFLSASLRCTAPGHSREETRQVFGAAGAPRGAGFNFELTATVAGVPESDSGWLISEEDFHQWLWQAAAHWDHTYINDCDPDFAAQNPTLENLSQVAFERLSKTLAERKPQLELVRVRLKQGDDWWVDSEGPGLPLLLTARFHLNCLHRHHNPDLSMDENIRLYNKCAFIHGHEYQIEVTRRGQPQPEYGVVYSRAEFQSVVQEKLLERYSETYLNEVIGNTSGEILTEEWSRVLREQWGESFGYVVVRETRKNSFVEATNGRSQALFLL
jgi:6-pyruvoyltetrahydropterin/6-carboxytetrahydropterin synthase